MAFFLPHLHTAFAVDQAILQETQKVVAVRFGSDADPECMLMDETLYKAAELVKNFCIIYLVDKHEVPEFTVMYELFEDCALMFFFRNKHIMVDCGTGNNNKITWALRETQEFVDLAEIVYRGAVKGKGLVTSPHEYSTKYRY